MTDVAVPVRQEPPARVRVNTELVDSPVAHPHVCCRRVWAEWFAWHGIDPAEVLTSDSTSTCSGFVFRDVDSLSIRFMPLEPMAGQRFGEWTTFQLEAPPLLPFLSCLGDHGNSEEV